MALSRYLTLALASGAILALALSANADTKLASDDVSQLEVSPALILMADGKAVYMKKCKKCHAEDGKGKAKMKEKHNIPDFTDAAWQGKNNKAAVVKATTEGSPPKDGKKSKMKAFKDKLTAEEISAVADFIKAMK